MTINVLGPLTVFSGGAELRITRPQSRHLLNVLSVEDHLTSSSVLIDALWPAAPPRNPENQLQIAVKRLRTALGDDDRQVVVQVAHGYRLNPECVSVDVWRWRRAIQLARESGSTTDAQAAYAEARALWRGRPFDGLDDSEILEAERRALEASRMEAMLHEAGHLISSGSHGAATLLLESAARDAPLRADLVILRLDAFHAAGRIKEGLELASSFRQSLRDSLGVSPSEEFLVAESRLLTQSSAPVVRASIDHRGSPRQTPRSVWRLDAIGGLRSRAVGAVRAARSLLVLVPAPPRQGLTSFLATIAQTAPSTVQIDWLERRVASPEPHTMRRDFEDGCDVAGAVTELARRASQHGLLLVIDDLHRLDDWSSSLLQQLAVDPPPGVAVIGGVDLSWISQHRDRFAGFTVEPLGRLHRDDIESMIAAAWPSMSPAERRHHGNRILAWSAGEVRASGTAVLSIASGEDGDLPPDPSVAEAIIHRFAELSEIDAYLVSVAAVLGFEIDLHHVAATAGQTVEAALGAISRAEVGDLVTAADRPGQWRFTSLMARAAIAERVPTVDACGLHRRAAEYALASGSSATRIANHLVKALPLVAEQEVIAASTLAARELDQSGDRFEASTYWDVAAQLSHDEATRLSYRMHQARCLDLAGLPARAHPILRQVTERAAALELYDLLAEAALAGDGHSGRIGGQSDRRERLAVAANCLPSGDRLRDDVICELAYELWAARLPVPTALVDHVRSVEKDSSSPAQLLARRLLLALADYAGSVPFSSAKALVVDATRDDHKRGPVVQGRCLVMAIYVALTTGNWSHADGWITEMHRLGTLAGEPRLRWQSLAYRAALLSARGLSDAAKAAADEALDVGMTLDVADALPTYGLDLVTRAFLSGSLATQAASLEFVPEQHRYPVWFALRGLAAYDAGEELTARDRLADALVERPGEVDPFRAQWLAFVALLAARLGRTREAGAAATLLAPWSGRFLFFGNGGPFIGPVDWFRAVAADAAGEAAAARGLQAKATALASAAGAELWLRSPHESRALPT